jgi:hypothetical protein
LDFLPTAVFDQCTYATVTIDADVPPRLDLLQVQVYRYHLQHDPEEYA